MCRPKRKVKHDSQSEVIMSKRVQLISNEDLGMVFVRDDKGEEYVCYARDVNDFQEGEPLNEQQQRRCLDTSLVLGDTW